MRFKAIGEAKTDFGIYRPGQNCVGFETTALGAAEIPLRARALTVAYFCSPISHCGEFSNAQGEFSNVNQSILRKTRYCGVLSEFTAQRYEDLVVGPKEASVRFLPLARQSTSFFQLKRVKGTSF